MAGPAHRILPLPVFDDPVRVLIVRAPYYADIADNLLQGARAMLEKAGAEHDLIEVPGAFEIPSAIATAFRQADHHGFVALGCVIRGETSHYDIVAGDSAHGLMLLGLQGACIGNGILTVDAHAQAAVRSDPAGQDKGGDAAAACLSLISHARTLGKRPKGIGFRSGEAS
jgi:6,7-dimethyl-8-ribityllumazine synthase